MLHSDEPTLKLTLKQNMFSQQNKAAKLAWLESDSSKPMTLNNDDELLGRNLFDLGRPKQRSPPTRRNQPQHFNHHKHLQGRDSPQLVEGLLQRPVSVSPSSHQEPNSRHSANTPVGNQRTGSQASFLANSTSDDDLEQDAGSLRQLQRGTRLSSPAAHKPGAGKWLSGDTESSPRSSSAAASGRSVLERMSLCLWRLFKIMGFLLVLTLIVYFWPIESRLEFEPRVAPPKPRPKFVGTLEMNSHLDDYTEKLYENQFHAPESMAWTADKRAFYTGVEGGFILLVEPYADRWTVAAKLNARHSIVDLSKGVRFVGAPETGSGDSSEPTSSSSDATTMVPFCDADIQLYGPRAEFEPSRVKLSRCSRPLGVRMAPDGSRLYVADPLSGVYLIELAANLSQALADRAKPLHKLNRVVKLIDFAGQQGEGSPQERPTRPDQVYFGDDIAVNFGGGASSSEAPGGQRLHNDIIYLTDCSRRWSLRYLIWLMLENDETGRVLQFDVAKRELSAMGSIVPVSLDKSSGLESQPPNTQLLDERGLSFPNGLELTADKSGLLISDLNNRRILRHHLSGPRAGTTELLMWVPGYSDNIKRGLDEPDGTPTYWFACGCAVSDNKYELVEVLNDMPVIRRLVARWLHVFGTIVGSLGRLFDSTMLKDAGFLLDAAWLKVDPYCTHGLVAQFNEQGEILRSLHGQSYSSNFRLISEAHQVPMAAPEDQTVNGDTQAANNRSMLYLGSVYYSYLGRIDLSTLKPMEPSAAADASTASA